MMSNFKNVMNNYRILFSIYRFMVFPHFLAWCLWKVLKEYCVRGKLLGAVKTFYSDMCESEW